MKENFSKIKRTLEEANRYEEVTELLHKIVSKVDPPASYPVNAYAGEDKKIKYYVESSRVKEEAEKLLQAINGDIVIEDKYLFDCFENLWRYINSNADIMLHNYAVNISHRSKPDIDMDRIRIFMILGNLIVNLDNREDDESDWDIPDGWKRKKDENLTFFQWLNMYELMNKEEFRELPKYKQENYKLEFEMFKQGISQYNTTEDQNFKAERVNTMSDMCTDNHMTSYSSFSENEISTEKEEKVVMKKAMVLCVSRSGCNMPYRILIETDINRNERVSDAANRTFEKYKKTQNIDDLRLIDYTYCGNIEIVK